MSDLRVKRGDTIRLVIGPILTSDGSVQNITGYTITFTAKDRVADADPGAFQSVGTVTDGPGGMGLVIVPKTATSSFLTDRVFHWDVQIVDPSGATKTIDEGKLYVTRDVTRA